MAWGEPSGWEDRHTLDSGRVLLALRARRTNTAAYPFVARVVRPPRRRRWLDALGVGMALVTLCLTDLMTGGGR